MESDLAVPVPDSADRKLSAPRSSQPPSLPPSLPLPPPARLPASRLDADPRPPRPTADEEAHALVEQWVACDRDYRSRLDTLMRLWIEPYEAAAEATERLGATVPRPMHVYDPGVTRRQLRDAGFAGFRVRRLSLPPPPWSQLPRAAACFSSARYTRATLRNDTEWVTGVRDGRARAHTHRSFMACAPTSTSTQRLSFRRRRGTC